MPVVEPIIVEPDDPYGPFGAKGVGEPPYSIPAPAIANAIYNAVGVRCNEIPINIRAVLLRAERSVFIAERRSPDTIRRLLL